MFKVKDLLLSPETFEDPIFKTHLRCFRLYGYVASKDQKRPWLSLLRCTVFTASIWLSCALMLARVFRGYENLNDGATNCMIYCFDEIACKQFSGWLAPKAQVKSSHPFSLWTLQRLYLRLNMAIFHGHKQVAKLHSFEVVQGLWKISASWWIELFNHFFRGYICTDRKIQAHCSWIENIRSWKPCKCKFSYFKLNVFNSRTKEKTKYIVLELRTFLLEKLVSTNVLILSRMFLIQDWYGRS